jgi:hypothetical protein
MGKLRWRMDRWMEIHELTWTRFVEEKSLGYNWSNHTVYIRRDLQSNYSGWAASLYSQSRKLHRYTHAHTHSIPGTHNSTHRIHYRFSTISINLWIHSQKNPCPKIPISSNSSQEINSQIQCKTHEKFSDPKEVQVSRVLSRFKGTS